MLIMRNLSYHLTTDLENPRNLLQFLQLGRYDWFTRNRKWIVIGVLVYFIGIGYLPLGIPAFNIYDYPQMNLFFASLGVAFFLVLGLIFMLSFYFFVDTTQQFRLEPKKGVEICLKGLSNILSDSLQHKSAGSFILNDEYPSVYKTLLEECYIYLDEYLSKSDQCLPTTSINGALRTMLELFLKIKTGGSTGYTPLFLFLN